MWRTDLRSTGTQHGRQYADDLDLKGLDRIISWRDHHLVHKLPCGLKHIGVVHVRQEAL